MDNIRYRTMYAVRNIGTDKEKIIGRVTIASDSLNEDNTEFRAGFSYCSNRDKFVRKHGQKIARGRLEHTPTYFSRMPESKFLDELKHAIVNSEKTSTINWMKDLKEINLK